MCQNLLEGLIFFQNNSPNKNIFYEFYRVSHPKIANFTEIAKFWIFHTVLLLWIFEPRPEPDICCLRNRLVNFKIGCFWKIIFNSSTLNSYRTISCLSKQIQVYLLGALGMYSFHIAYQASHRAMTSDTVIFSVASNFLYR